MNNPILSVLILTKNRKRLLERAIKSVLNQTFLDYEIVVGNEASTDGTEEFLRELSRSNNKIRYITNKTPLGIVGNEKMLIDEARGKYAIYLADDDYFYDKDFFEKAICMMESDIDIVMTCAGTAIVDMDCNVENFFLPPMDGRINGLKFFEIHHWTVAGNAFMARTSLLKEVVFEIADDNWESGVEMSNLLSLKGDIFFLSKTIASAWTKNPESMGGLEAQKDPLKLAKGIDGNWKLYKKAKGKSDSKGLLHIEKRYLKSMLNHFIEELTLAGYSDPEKVIKIFEKRDFELGIYIANLYKKYKFRLAGQTFISLFGANIASKDSLEVLLKYNIKCDFIMDDYFTDTFYCGIEVKKPKDVNIDNTIIIMPGYKPKTIYQLKKRLGRNRIIENRNILYNVDILRKVSSNEH